MTFIALLNNKKVIIDFRWPFMLNAIPCHSLRSSKRGRTNLIDGLCEGRPSRATTEDNISAVRLMIETQKSDRPADTDKLRHRYELSCGWESLMKNVTLGNVTMSHRTRERPAECLASLSHSTMIGLPRAQH
ncbi:hypothetical protein EVAR_22369_1 [Eumeta japonica]|uniref:Uncharacterized protein n=1 Tax=Eumeta variegata TaxID=151549 RepID=A0A4C1VJG0_EUMVA|nr:hypothetical protein EVAR_22369_1 [Eumeta japonica]